MENENFIRFARVRHFFCGAGLPVFLVTAALVYEAFLLAVVFAPPGSGPWSTFSEEFKTWCFSYDPRTGGLEWAAVWVMLLEPPTVLAFAVVLWRSSLREMFKPAGWAAHWRAAVAGPLVSVLILGGVFVYARPAADEPLPPFPGERIRSQLTPPSFTLTDHHGEEVALEDLRGRVVVVTGVYAVCSTSCPQILRQLKDLTESLAPEVRERVALVALSLNPDYDTSNLMRAVAQAYDFPYPHFRYLNGAPDEMRDLLTRFQFSPVLNPETGVIDHANLFIVIDAGGRIAYRFGLDPRQRTWLHEAVTQLVGEIGPLPTEGGSAS